MQVASTSPPGSGFPGFPRDFGYGHRLVDLGSVWRTSWLGSNGDREIVEGCSEESAGNSRHIAYSATHALVRLAVSQGCSGSPSELPRVLFPPSSDKGPFTGEDVLAFKRVVAHAQRWLPWVPTNWDNVYNERFAMGRGTGEVEDTGVRGFQRQEGLDDTGVINDATYQRMRRARIPIGERKGAPIMDAEAVRLLRIAADEHSEDAKVRKIRASMSDFMRRAEANERVWHYDMRRPFTGFGVSPEQFHINDCSGYAILTYHWARKETGTLIPDPSGYRYSGYGNTWDDLDGHTRVVSGNYLVGDLAHYDGHVTICRVAGGGQTSRWSSFGAEGGPDDLSLYYRPDFIKVVRPRLLPA